MKRMTRTSRLTALLAAVALTTAACGSSADQSEGGENLSWRYATNTPQSSTIESGSTWFVDAVNEQLSGRLAIEPFWAASLVAQGEEFQATQDGTVQIGHMVQTLYNEQFPLWGIGAVPFLAQDPEAQLRAFAKLAVENEAFRNEFESQGVRLLFFKPLSQFTMGFPTPVTSIEQMRGKRVRTLGFGPSQALTAIGVEPIDVALNEIYDATSRGTIDGWAAITLELANIALGLQEVSPYMVNTGFGLYTSLANVVSLEAWNALPDGLRAEVERLVAEQYDVAIETLNRQESEACRLLTEAGGTVTNLPDAEIEAWRDLVLDSLLQRWRDNAIAQGVAPADVDQFEQDYYAALEEFGATSTFQSGLDACAS